MNDELYNIDIDDPYKLQFDYKFTHLIIQTMFFMVQINRTGEIKIYDYRNTPFYPIESFSMKLNHLFEDNLKLFLNIEDISKLSENSSECFHDTCKRFMKINVFT